MPPDLLPLLRSPEDPNGPPLALTETAHARDGEVIAGTAWAGSHGPYRVVGGVLDLLDGTPFPVSLAQRSNFLWPTTAYYEQVWRVRSLSLLGGGSFPVRDELALLNAWVQPRRGGVYVDIGTSHGLYARNIARELRESGADGTVFALDIAAAMLRRAGALVARKGYTRIGLVRARAQALPLPDGAADGVVNGGTFNEMGEQEAALREVRRTLKPDGVFFCMSLVAARGAAAWAVQRFLGTSGLIFPTRDATNTLYDAAGLTITAQEQRGVVLLTRAVVSP